MAASGTSAARRRSQPVAKGCGPIACKWLSIIDLSPKPGTWSAPLPKVPAGPPGFWPERGPRVPRLRRTLRQTTRPAAGVAPVTGPNSDSLGAQSRPATPQSPTCTPENPAPSAPGESDPQVSWGDPTGTPARAPPRPPPTPPGRPWFRCLPPPPGNRGPGRFPGGASRRGVAPGCRRDR